MSIGVAVAGWGVAVPDGVLTNHDLEQMLDTTDEWIVERSGIRERRVAGPDESTTSLAVAAGVNAIKHAGLVPDDIDLLVMATCTPDQRLPAASALVHRELGLRCGAFDVGAACAGFVYALVVANSLLTADPSGPRIMVIGSETLTRITDPDDRGTRVLFGDGAAAMILSSADVAAKPGGLLAWDLGCDGSAVRILEIPAGDQYIRMEGREVFRRAVRAVVDSAQATLDRAGLQASDIDLFVPHQANIRIIDAVNSRLGIPSERTAVNIDRYGNTSAASVPLALIEAAEAGRIEDGALVLLSGFGAGMSWASAVLRWNRG